MGDMRPEKSRWAKRISGCAITMARWTPIATFDQQCELLHTRNSIFLVWFNISAESYGSRTAVPFIKSCCWNATQLQRGCGSQKSGHQHEDWALGLTIPETLLATADEQDRHGPRPHHRGNAVGHR